MVFVDCDTGVDDAVALVYLLGDPDTELAGIACTGGNVGLQQVCGNNLALVELCGRPEIAVSAGAAAPLRGTLRTAANIHGPQGLGYARLPAPTGRLSGDSAAAAWISAAHRHPGELVGLAVGPLTNLALALRAEPALPTLLRRLVIMGGAFAGERAGRAEFNIGADPQAAAEVLAGWESAAPQQLPILCGLELTQRIALTPKILGEMATAAGPGSPLFRMLDDALRFYFEAHRGAGHGYRAYLHDPLAAAVALEPDLIGTAPAAVRIELTGPVRGRTIPDWAAARPNARIGTDVDPRVFFTRLAERVGALARRLG